MHMEHPESAFLNEVAGIESELTKVQAPIIQKINALLSTLEGKTFESWEEAVRTVDAVKLLVRQAGCLLLFSDRPVRLQCIHSPDSKPKIQVRTQVSGKQTALYNTTKFPSVQAKPIS